MKRIHRVLVIGLHDALSEALFDGKYADKALEFAFKSNKKWGSKDRAFIAEAFYDIIRWKRKYAYFMNEEVKPYNVYTLIATHLLYNNVDLPNFDEFKDVNVKEIRAAFKQKITNPAVEESVPDWLYELIETHYKEETQEIFKALNAQAKVYLRVNLLKTTPTQLIEALAKDNIIATEVEGKENALVLNERKNVFRSKAFQDGWFEVQDVSSQLVAEALDVKPGMRVVDTCAGAGGKTLHLASLMKNKGQIIALDIYDWKLKELKRRAKRAGAHNIETRTIESTKTIKRLKDGADAVLIDAPCSGLGVLKRNPDAKWKLDTDFIARVQREQLEILQSNSRILRHGGKLVYATCSILPTENEVQVEKFLETNPSFKLIKQETLLPNKTGHDGFFIAVMEKMADV